jgi:hypothetical protein
MAAKRNGLKRFVQLACFIVKVAARYLGPAEAAAAGVTSISTAGGGLATCLGQMVTAAQCVCQYRENPAP